MGNTLYLECYSGISGDMTVAALLDLGADEKVLRDALDSIPVQGFDIEITRVKKSGIDACDFHVVLEQENYDHDMEYLYGHTHERHHEHNPGRIHEHHHEHGQECTHEHHHEHSQEHTHEHHHIHRGMKEITRIIKDTGMTDRAKTLALSVFDILAEAEAKAHGIPRQEVHFHEVGAVDSIVDIIAVAVCLDNLDIENVIVPSLYEGKGTVRCQHGILPVPVPAVVHIIQMYGLPLQIMEMEGEYITPTGAAIVAAVRTKDTLPESFVIQKIGIGAGKRQYDGPGILRAMLIRE